MSNADTNSSTRLFIVPPFSGSSDAYSLTRIAKPLEGARTTTKHAGAPLVVERLPWIVSFGAPQDEIRRCDRG